MDRDGVLACVALENMAGENFSSVTNCKSRTYEKV